MADGNGRTKGWKPGQSGNPGGLSKAARRARQAVRDALDAAFTEEVEDEHGNKKVIDTLIMAIVDGVKVDRDATCIKLACEYRWGKPVQPVEITPEQLSDNDLKRALTEVVDQWKDEEAMQ